MHVCPRSGHTASGIASLEKYEVLRIRSCFARVCIERGRGLRPSGIKPGSSSYAERGHVTFNSGGHGDGDVAAEIARIRRLEVLHEHAGRRVDSCTAANEGETCCRRNPGNRRRVGRDANDDNSGAERRGEADGGGPGTPCAVDMTVEF